MTVDTIPFWSFFSIFAFSEFCSTFTAYDIFSNPVVYILDKDKKIIAKRVSISQIEDILDRLQNKTDSPKLFPPDPEEDEQMQKKE